MYRDLRIAIVIPAYNEEKLIAQTIETVPSFVDYIVTINDGSKDKTFAIQSELAKKNKKVIVVNNERNMGLGTSMVRGYKRALETDADVVGIVSGDAQCPPDKIKEMLDRLVDTGADYVKANRFVDLEALKKMPRVRRMGNIFITLLTKFSTGYYNLSDALCSFGVMRRTALEQMPLHMIGKRYDFENTQLIAMSIAHIRIIEHPVPALYGEETSTINVWSTSLRVFRALFVGFWKRIYYKYVFNNFHPIALFLFAGLLLLTLGIGFGIYLIAVKAVHGVSPSTGSVMLSVVPFILGFQLLLSAITMDMNDE